MKFRCRIGFHNWSLHKSDGYVYGYRCKDCPAWKVCVLRYFGDVCL
jgi:hypothetical protein